MGKTMDAKTRRAPDKMIDDMRTPSQATVHDRVIFMNVDPQMHLILTAFTALKPWLTLPPPGTNI